MRDLYAAASKSWVDAGLTRHFAFVPAMDDLVAPWPRLSFGTSAALAARPAVADDGTRGEVTVRLTTRLGSRARPDGARDRLGPREWLPDDHHWLADDEPRGVPVLARPRLPPHFLRLYRSIP
ncbi:MAG: hypothetical protein M3O64_03135 [Chloroflexota bacterium]|nr:hypothetical protein [Chloroflexota bacterium]